MRLQVPGRPAARTAGKMDWKFWVGGSLPWREEKWKAVLNEAAAVLLTLRRLVTLLNTSTSLYGCTYPEVTVARETQ